MKQPDMLLSMVFVFVVLGYLVPCFFGMYQC